jgi:OFA family oxalate/formate antiporter-like MFS transporter
MQMLLGIVYAWSVFKKPLMEAHGWSNTDVGLTFTILIAVLGVAAAFGGRFVDRSGARNVAITGAVLFGLGTILAGVADAIGSKWLLWIGYGVLGGIGNGLGYVTPIAVLVRWFPDKRGVITGLAVMGFGLGAAIMGKVAPGLIQSIGVPNTFYATGAVILVVLTAAAMWLNNPPEGWMPAGWSPAANGSLASGLSCNVASAVRMNQFYLLWGILFINVTAGIALISNLSPMAQSQVRLSALAAGTVIFVTSLCNGFGRILWASVSDRIGRRTVFLLMLGTQVPVLLLLPGLSSSVLFTAACCYILLCYGGGFATMPAFVADTFGPECLGAIYGKVLLAWSAGGVVGPVLMEYAQKQSGTFSTALQIAAGMLTLGFVLALLYRKPAAPLATQNAC